MSIKKLQKGQTLLEALIALSLLVIVLGVSSVAVITGIKNSVSVKQQAIASKYAQDGLEYLKDQVTNNNKFSVYTGYNLQCLYANSTVPLMQAGSCPNSTYYLPPPPANGIYKREATFSTTRCGSSSFANGLNITVKVYWTDNKCPSGTSFCHSQSVSTCLVDPSKVVPTPIPTIYQGVGGGNVTPSPTPTPTPDFGSIDVGF